MAVYVVLGNFTEQGIKNIRHSPERARVFQQMAETMGIKPKAVYWTMGVYDIVLIVDSPDDETLAASLMALGAQGNVRTTTLRAFGSEGMTRIIGKMPT
jgi:uncharacterized protein with GYD domain